VAAIGTGTRELQFDALCTVSGTLHLLPDPNRRWDMRHSVLFPALAVLVMTACTKVDEFTAKDGGTREFREEAAFRVESSPDSPVAQVAGIMGANDMASETEGGTGFTLPNTGVAALPVDAMLIRTGSASIEVRSLTPAIEQVRALAGQMGGFVANTSIQAGNERLRSASIELRIPNDRFDAAVSGLNGLGKLETVQISTEDVGEQYTDIEARVTNAHRLEDRLIDVLAHRPGKLQDILAVERELARVREEIERYEGRLRFLKSRAATSRMTLSIHEPVPVIEQRGQSPLVDAVRQAWGRFLGLVALAIGWSGVVIPVGLVTAGAWWTMRRRRRTLPQPA